MKSDQSKIQNKTLNSFSLSFLTSIIFPALFILSFLSACSSGPSTVSLALPKVAHLKVAETVVLISDEEAWQDKRIGFGLKQQLIDLVYQSGKFTLIDENLSQTKADFLVQIKVKNHYRDRTRAGIGLANLNHIKTIVELEITLHDLQNQQSWTTSGEGTAETEAGSFIFSFQENSDHFEKTEVSLATEMAIQDAWSKFQFTQLK